MGYFLEHLKLLLHQSRVHFSLHYLSLLDDFDGAGLFSIEVVGLVDFAKLSGAEDLLELVNLADILHFVKPFETS